VHWLDQHSGAIVAIATAVLVIITATYVGLTRSLTKAAAADLEATKAANALAREANDMTRQALNAQLDERVRRQASLMSAWMESRNDAEAVTTFVGHYKNDSPAADFRLRVLHDA